MLSDTGIWAALLSGDIEIDPLRDEDAVQPASVDLHLSDRDLIMLPSAGITVPWIDQRGSVFRRPFDEEIGGRPATTLDPGEFALASTRERVRFGPRLSGQLEGKSGLARLGLIVHVTAGFFDPGFEGWPTLELVNLSPRPIALSPGMPISQMCFFDVGEESKNPYDRRGKYVNQGEDPEPSAYHENFHRVLPGWNGAL